MQAPRLAADLRSRGRGIDLQGSAARIHIGAADETGQLGQVVPNQLGGPALASLSATRNGQGHQQRATEDWALERDNDPMPGRAWDTPLVGRTAELILHNALGAAVGGRPAIAVLRVKPASRRTGWRAGDHPSYK